MQTSKLQVTDAIAIAPTWAIKGVGLDEEIKHGGPVVQQQVCGGGRGEETLHVRVRQVEQGLGGGAEERLCPPLGLQYTGLCNRGH